MTGSIYSNEWHRVRYLQPRLSDQVRLERHCYRSRIWYVLYDPLNRRVHRFSPETYQAIASFDGYTTLDKIWNDLQARSGDTAPTQDQLIDLLKQLHQADLLMNTFPPNDAEVIDRRQRQRRQHRYQRFAMPLFQTLHIANPTPLLDRLLVVLTPGIRRSLAVIWLLSVPAALVLALQYWSELNADVLDRLTTPQSLVVIALLYPLLKLLHELGHALTARCYGVEVREVGITLTVGLPLPYVNVTASALLPSKLERMAIAAAGIAVDLLLASLALFAWILLEPGLLRTAAYNVMAMGGLSSLLVNGNPLLRFDGYYVLQDWLEIPNLNTRASSYLKTLFNRYVLHDKRRQAPDLAPGEALWLILYGIGAWLFRNLGLAVLLLLVIDRYPVLGTFAALLTIGLQWLWPVLRNVLQLFSRPATIRSRSLAMMILISLTTVVLALPLPAWTIAEGVLLPPPESIVRTETSGVVMRLLASPNTFVQVGDPLFELNDPFLQGDHAVLQARQHELQASYHAKWRADPVAAQKINDDLESLQAEIRHSEQRLNALVVRSPGTGRLIVPDADDLPGRYVKQGEALGYVLPAKAPLRAQVLVSQNRISLVRDSTQSVAVLLTEADSQAVSAQITRATPQAVSQLPGAALGPQGGGSFAVNPEDKDGLRTLEHYFQFELEVRDDRPIERLGIGSRLQARFEHVPESLAVQGVRAVRQLLLHRIDV